MTAPPVLDFSAFYGDDDSEAKKQLISDVRRCCLHNGFFQITGHRVSRELQERAMACSKRFFALPLQDKERISKNNNSWNRGYELMSTQMLEAGAEPDLKEGLYLSEDVSETDPRFMEKKLNTGPNQWPVGFSHPAELEEFKKTTMEYWDATCALARDVLSVIARTLDLPAGYFERYGSVNPVATVRLLHYPPQPPNASANARGVGAHTDFGTVTLLLQDEVGGLQVLDHAKSTWVDVIPVPGAYVVNLGNLFQRWTNDRYRSNLHRVINKSGQERFSIPMFFNGDPDYVCECLPNCLGEGETAKYPPITVTDAILGGYRDSYGRAKAYAAAATATAAGQAAKVGA